MLRVLCCTIENSYIHMAQVSLLVWKCKIQTQLARDLQTVNVELLATVNDQFTVLDSHESQIRTLRQHTLTRLLGCYCALKQYQIQQRCIWIWWSRLSAELCATIEWDRTEDAASRIRQDVESRTKSHVTAGIELLWLWLCTLEPNKISKRVFPSSTLDPQLFLSVCHIFDPEMSSIGVLETLGALGMTSGRLTEAVFQRWMAVMFAGCADCHVLDGISMLAEATNGVKFR